MQDALCNSKTLVLSRDYYDRAALDIFKKHTETARLAIITVRHIGGSITVADIPVCTTGAVTVTANVHGMGHRCFIVGDVAYSLPVKYYYTCSYADGIYTLANCRRLVSSEMHLDILRFFSQYTHISPYFRLNIMPAGGPRKGTAAGSTTPAEEVHAVITLFPTRFPQYPPVIMDGAFVAKYARHIPADGQLQVAQISDEAAGWLSELRDHDDINRRGLFDWVPTMEDVADILTVFGELGIQSAP